MAEGTQRKLAAIVSTDVVGYSRLMGADEIGTLAALRAHRAELIDPSISEHGGRIVKTMGDGLLLEFPSVVEAVRSAIQVQEGMAARNENVPSEKKIVFRIGINLGDIIIDGEDIHGDGVNIAARLQGIAAAGGISISSRVYEDVRDRLDAAFEDLGPQELKNITRPVHVWCWSSRRVEPMDTDTVDSIDNAPLLPDKPSVAVLPFENMSGDPDQEYFADGIVEEITAAISKVQSFFVVSRNSAFAFKGKPVDIKLVSRRLGVRYVLEGSVRKSGNRVRITAQLIDAVSDRHVWADQFDGTLDDIFDLQDRITESVVGAI